MQRVLLAAVLASLVLACQPPPVDDAEEPAPDTIPSFRQRTTSIDGFDGCYYQGQRFSVGSVKIQDGVLKKCVEVEAGTWRNVDGFGNQIPEDPSVEDTLSPPDTTAVADTTSA